MVYRVFAEKKEGLASEAEALKRDIRNLLGIDKLQGIRVINRYDVGNIDAELFDDCRWKVFASPQVDNAASQIEELPFQNVATEDVIRFAAAVFAVEPLPGLYDQRADAAEQCIQMISRGMRPVVRCAKVYVLYGELGPMDIEAIKAYLIDPALTREASLDMPEGLETGHEAPDQVATLTGFTTMADRNFPGCIAKMDLEMDEADLAMCVDYFRDVEDRDPTITELRTIDAYWSDRCRHTALNTVIDSVIFEDPLLEKAYKDYLGVRKAIRRNRPVTLNDIATMTAKELKLLGRLDKLDESGETEACTVKINVEVDGENEPWLLLFRNDTDNHPLLGRALAYSAMRITGAAEPVARDSSGGSNKAGLCTGVVDEVYHPDYASGRMEAGAVMAAVPAVNVRIEKPEPGNVIMLLSGSAGRIRSFFRSSTVTRMIRRVSDFSAGGIGVAAGRLADGVEIDLNAVADRYEGLDGTALAMSRSRDMMCCVIDAVNEDLFRVLASYENLRCVRVAMVTEEPRLVMRWNRKKIVDISGEFLASNGADKHTDVAPARPGNWLATSMYREARSFTAAMHDMAQNLNICSKRGLSERFDSTIGAGTVLMPFGGRYQITPVQAMVHKIPLDKGDTDDCSLMAWGYNPNISGESPYHGAYLAVVESIAKLIASGASFREIYLSFSEHFGAPGGEPSGWGAPFAAMLGAFEAQNGLGVAAIGSRESMTETLEGFRVNPSLISFAVTMGKVSEIVSPEFKKADHRVIVLKPELGTDDKGAGRGLPKPESLIRVWQTAYDMISSGEAVAAYTPGIGGIAEAVMKMCFGNGIGFRYEPEVMRAKQDRPNTYGASGNRTAAIKEIFGYSYGSIILEIDDGVLLTGLAVDYEELRHTTGETSISLRDERLKLGALPSLYEGRLENVFPTRTPGIVTGHVENVNYQARGWNPPIFKRAEPKAVIPVFPGTNCEHDSMRAVREAGAQTELVIIKDRTFDDIKYSAERLARAIKDAQMLFIPGGYSCGDEPDGAAKFIAAFMRDAAVTESVTELLDKQDGLICGICNGFQALIRLGLVPYGKITDTDEWSPALTYNTVGSYRSGIARVRIASNKSPWLRYNKVGEIFSVPVSHSEGRFVGTDDLISHLAGTGQIATQYVDMKGNASGDIRYNPSGSMMAVEGICSPDGRVFGRMGHSERTGRGLYRNVEGNYLDGMFENAVKYFK